MSDCFHRGRSWRFPGISPLLAVSAFLPVLPFQIHDSGLPHPDHPCGMIDRPDQSAHGYRDRMRGYMPETESLPDASFPWSSDFVFPVLWKYGYLRSARPAFYNMLSVPMFAPFRRHTGFPVCRPYIYRSGSSCSLSTGFPACIG